MRNSFIVIIIGIVLIASSVIIFAIYWNIETSNRPDYIASEVISSGGQLSGKVDLASDNQVSVTLAIKQSGIPVNVKIYYEDGPNVLSFDSSAKFNGTQFENLNPAGSYNVVTTNLGDEPVEVVVSVRNLKEPGTFIDTPDAWVFLVPSSETVRIVGFLILLGGIGWFFVERRKTTVNH